MIPAALLLAAMLAAPAAVDPAANVGTVSVPLDGNIGKPIIVRRARAGDRLEVDLIRAEVRVERSATDRIALEVLGPDGEDFARIALRISWDGDRTSVTDTFPQRYGRGWDECLPPPDERGDFWLVRARPRIVLYVPAGVVLDIRVREGGLVRAGARNAGGVARRD